VSKYQALPQHLDQADSMVQRSKFGEIEGILGFKLPKSAYRHEAWWSNNDNGHSHAGAWLKAGWRTEALDLTKREVTFRRAGQFPLLDAPPQRRDPWGCMAGTVTILPDIDLTAPSGEHWNAEQGRLLHE
jgi:hypothetical protein